MLITNKITFQAFGCDGKIEGKFLDSCGVCGGDNSSCTVFEGVNDTDVASGNPT